MERFEKVPAKITVEGLENQEIDLMRSDLIEEHRKRNDNSKHYIRENMNRVR